MVFAHDTAIEILNSHFSIFKIFVFFSSLFTLAVMFTKITNAEVVINELLPNPTGEDSGNEWVELYNTGDSEISVTNYKLKDLANHEQLIVSGSIASHGFMLINVVSPLSLNNEDEAISLFSDSSSEPISTFPYSTSTEGKSLGRYPDGTSINTNPMDPTPNGSNQIPSPTPTTAPSPSPSPSLLPSPSPTSTPTPTPAKKPSPTPVTSRFPSPSPLSQTDDEETLARGETLGLGITSSPSPEAEATSESKKFPLAAISLITGGLALVGVASYLFFRSFQKERKERAMGRVEL